MSDEKKLPKRRFKQFLNTPTWEQRKLGEVVERVSCTSEDSEIPQVEYEDIISGEGRLNKDITKKLSNKKGILFRKGDVLYGKLRPYLKNWLLPDFSGKAVGDFWVLRSEKVQSSFLYNLIQSNRFELASNQSTGTKMPRADWNLVANTEFPIPVSIEEQISIGNIFKLLNDSITLHQRKLNKLEKLKKAYLEELFPTGNQCKPKRRFKEFKDDWEQRKLGEVAEIVRGASPRPIADPKWFDNKSDIGWLRISDVTSQDGRIKSLEQRISKLGQEKTRVLMTPHLLLSIAATVGKPVINYVPTGVHDGFLIFMNPKFNIIYAFWWLEMFREKWNRYGQPGSQVNLNSELVKNQEISLPSDEEQIAISSFFENFDNLITLHQRKLQKLKKLKAAYLEELFV